MEEIPYIATADLWDALEGQDKLQCVEPMLSLFGDEPAFFGPIQTLKVHEDNQLVRDAVNEPGQGRVLVVDGGGSLRSALVGDRLAQAAIDNGWAGIIVFGAIRDSHVIEDLPIGVYALGTCPVRSRKRGEGLLGIPLQFGGVTWTPEHWVYADPDGILVTSVPEDVSAGLDDQSEE